MISVRAIATLCLALLLFSGCNFPSTATLPAADVRSTQKELSGTIVALYLTMTAEEKPSSPTPSLTNSPTNTSAPSATTTRQPDPPTATNTAIPEPPTPVPPTCIHVGCQAPDFVLPRAGGGEVTLSDYLGQAILLNFWATWCKPCATETPGLQHAYVTFQDQGFVILGVSTDSPAMLSNVNDFIRSYKITYPILLDTKMKVADRYEASIFMDGLPKSYFIDKNGVIRRIVVGRMEDDNIEKWVIQILELLP